MGLVGFIVKVTSWFVVRVACYWDFGDTLADYLQVMCEDEVKLDDLKKLNKAREIEPPAFRSTASVPYPGWQPTTTMIEHHDHPLPTPYRTEHPDFGWNGNEAAPSNWNPASSFPAITIPQAFINEYLWKPTQKNATCAKVDPVPAESSVDSKNSATSFQYTFTPALLSEIDVAMTYAFLQASDFRRNARSQASGSDNPSAFSHEIGVTLNSPYHGGNAVLDAMVRIVAEKQNADVLVLDSLELAARKYGVMGEECHRVIDLLYESTSGYSREADKTNASNAVRDLFKTLLQIRVHSSDSKSRLGEVPRRRILYLRDFGSISHGATPIMCALLQAIHDLSSSKHDTDAVPSTMIFVLGVSRNIGMKGKPSKSEDKGCFKWLSWTQEATVGGLVDLADIVPPVPVGASAREPYPPHFHGFRVEEEYVIPVGGFSKYAGPLLSLLVMPLIHSRIGQVDIQPFITLDRKLEQHVESMSSDGPTLVCYPENTHFNEFRTAQQLEIIKRTDAINNLMLKVSVGKKGGSPVQGLSLSADMTGVYDTQPKTGIQSFILNTTSADFIATTAIGLSYIENPLSCSPVIVHTSHIFSAYKSFMHSKVARDAWLDAEKKACQANDEDDEVVEAVKAAKDLTEYEKRLISCIVHPRALTTSFDDVCIDPKVIEVLRTVVMLPILYPHHFKTGILAKEALSGALLYGPPGTGKTMVCRALARECGARMLSIKPSDIFDKWVGESEKLANSIFTLAYRLAPCVIFIDEVETLFGSRDHSSNWQRDVLTELLQALDGLHSAKMNKDKGISVIGATNRPFDLDLAILRRLPCRLFVDLPGKSERQRILTSHLQGHTLHEVDLVEVANIANGYSGADLKNLCVAAAMQSVKATIGQIDWTSKPIQKAHPESLPVPACAINMAHFEHAFTEVAPSLSPQANEELYEWHAKQTKKRRPSSDLEEPNEILPLLPSDQFEHDDMPILITPSEDAA